MLPERLLDVDLDGDEARPRYLTSRDHLGVEALADAMLSAAGLPRREVEARLDAAPSRGLRWRARRALIHLLLRRSEFAVDAPADPRLIRSVVFDAAACSTREAALTQAASHFGADASAIERALYADLPARRILRTAPLPDVPSLIEQYNLALAQGLLLRAETLRVRVEQSVRAVLRHARLQRLLCTVEAASDGSAVLVLSGPLSLFRFTTKYGRAMAAWLPVLLRTPRWALRADCVLQDRRVRWRASWRDPIGTTHVPLRRFDSGVEERLFRDLARLATDWEILREADPVRVGDSIVCPDFTLVHRARGARVPVEVVGYWTPEYLARKLATLRALPSPWVVCVDADLAISPQALPPGEVLTYRRRVDVGMLMSIVERRLIGAVKLDPPTDASPT